MSASLRLCIAVVIVAGVCISAANAACSATDTELFKQGASNSQTCAPARYCYNELCSCLLGTAGATHYNATGNEATCLGAASAVSCPRRAECLARTFGCLVMAADMYRNDASCSAWAAPIHLGYLAFASTGNLNGSSIFKACERAVCQLANASTNPANCDQTRDAQVCTCSSPLNTKVTITLNGDWSTAAGDDAKIATLSKAIEDDLAVKAGGRVCVVKVTLNADKTLTILVNVPQGIAASKLDGLTAADFTNLKGVSGVPTFTPTTTGATTPAPSTSTTPSPNGTSTTPAPTASAARVSAVVAVLVSIALSLVA